MSSSTQKQRRRRGSRKRHTRYHRLAFRNKLGSILEAHQEEEDQAENDTTPESTISQHKEAPRRGRKSELYRLVHEAKAEIVGELARSSGDASSSLIQQNLHKLSINYDGKNFDPRVVSREPPSPFAVCDTRLEGTWISLSKPNFSGCLGTNERGDYLYKLGRMSFDMFQPTELRCSIQGTFNVIKLVDSKDENAMKELPEALKADALHGKVPVRTYNIVTAFTVEPGQRGEAGPNQGVDEPIEGTMTTYGFLLPYPTGNRFSVWFTGGCIEVGHDIDRWQNVFDKQSLPGRTLAQKSKLLFAKLLMGAETSDEMDQNGKISYQLKRPIAANINMLYIDQVTRIMRGKSGVVYVFGRVQDVEELSESSDGEDSMEDCVPLASYHNFHTRRVDGSGSARWSSRRTSSKLAKHDRSSSFSGGLNGPRPPSRLHSPPTTPRKPRRRGSRSLSPSSVPPPGLMEAAEDQWQSAKACTKECHDGLSSSSGPKMPRRRTSWGDESAECTSRISQQAQGECGERTQVAGPRMPKRRGSDPALEANESISSVGFRDHSGRIEASRDDEPKGPWHPNECIRRVPKLVKGTWGLEPSTSGPKMPKRRGSLSSDDNKVLSTKWDNCTIDQETIDQEARFDIEPVDKLQPQEVVIEVSKQIDCALSNAPGPRMPRRRPSLVKVDNPAGQMESHICSSSVVLQLQ